MKKKDIKNKYLGRDVFAQQDRNTNDENQLSVEDLDLNNRLKRKLSHWITHFFRTKKNEKVVKNSHEFLEIRI